MTGSDKSVLILLISVKLQLLMFWSLWVHIVLHHYNVTERFEVVQCLRQQVFELIDTIDVDQDDIYREVSSCWKLHLFFMPSRLGNKEIMKKSNPKKVRWDVLQPQHFATYLWHYPTQSTPKRTELYPLCNRICLGGQAPLPKRKASKVLWFATFHWAKHAACVSQLLAWLDFQSEGLIETSVFSLKKQCWSKSWFRDPHSVWQDLFYQSAEEFILF